MENKQTAVSVQEKNICDGVLLRVKELENKNEIQFPANYSYANALKSAWLILQGVTTSKNDGGRPVLQACNKDSIANTLLDMVIQGLSPVKKQCYFVAYGTQLTLMRSYLGTVAATKRLKGVKNVIANCIYEGDKFAYELDLETGEKKIKQHEQSFENIDPAKIKGAYAIVVMEDGLQNHVEVMNIGQIRKAWNQGAAKGNSGAHNNFTDEMAKKTVINRACKMFVNTSDDSDILIQAINNATEDNYEDRRDSIEANFEEVHEEVTSKANQKVIDIAPEHKEEPPKNQQKSEQIEISADNQEDGPGF